ncbi:MAG: sugar phosphate isomerase/epimerase family protein [Candidatus Sumerlaeota bacterium]
MPEYCIGAQLFTLREYTQTIEDIQTTLKRVADIGYKTVQISGGGFFKVDPDAVADVLKSTGLQCVATHMGWNSFLEDLDNVIAIHKKWDCKHLAIGSLGGEYFESLEGVDRFKKELEPVAARLKAEGMDFSYHNHSHELVQYDGQTWLGYLYESIPGDILKAEIDVHWITRGGGDPAAWIKKCAGRQPLLHVKDFRVSREREPLFAPVGEGNMNWPAIIEAAKASGVDYYLVEQDQCYDEDPFDCLAQSYKNLQSFGLC